MRPFLLAITLTSVLASAAHAAQVSCLEYGDPSKTETAHSRSDSGTTNTGASNTTAQPNVFDQFDDWEPVPCVEGLLSGSIVGGDYENVVRLFRESHPLLRRFSLISPGGNVEEAMRIGRLFRKYTIAAMAPLRLRPSGNFVLWSPPTGQPLHRLCAGGSECTCASACALIWFGAVDRIGTVGLHRPHTDDLAFRAMTPSEASVAYRRMLDTVRTYLDEMEVPKQIIETMVATGSAEIRWVDLLENKVGRPPSIAEWEDASCGSFTDQEDRTLSLLLGKEHDRNLTQSDALVFKLLSEKRTRKFVCETALTSSHRERLPPP